MFKLTFWSRTMCIIVA